MKKDDLVSTIIPLFRKYPRLKTVKRKNFELFAKCLSEIQKGNLHLKIKGAIRLAQIMEKMNHKKVDLILSESSETKRQTLLNCREDRVRATRRLVKVTLGNTLSGKFRRARMV